MNEDDGNNRRMLLAAGMCLALLVVWNFIFPPVPPPPAEEVTGAEALENGSGDVANLAVGTTTTATTSAPVAITPEVPAELFEFQGVVTVDSDELPFEVALTNVGGAFESFRLPTFKERSSGNNAIQDPITLADPVAEESVKNLRFGQMAGIQFGSGTTFDVPRRPVYEVVEKRADYVKYRFVTASGVVIEREYQLSSDSFAVELAVTVLNQSSRPHKHELELGAALRANEATRQGSGWLASLIPPPDHLEATCLGGGSVYRKNVTQLAKGTTQEHEGDVRWVGMDRQYFLAALVARDELKAEAECELLGTRDDIARAAMVFPEVRLAPGESRRHQFTAYLGVKMPQLLEGVDAELGRAINYTVLGLNLAPLSELLLWILRMIHSVTGSWGLAIVGLTVLVKAVLFPLNQRQGKSMRAMSALKPEMDKIRERFPEDRQRQSEEMMRLYKEHNVSPASGCLPMLLQMPIWIALYRALWVSVDLYQEGFLWIADLTTRDPYWILPVLLMAVMFLQQKMMPAAMDPAQQKVMMYTMPLIFGSLMSALPAGLCLYILVNTLLTIVQQHLINRSIGPPPGANQPVEQGAPS